MQQTNKDQGFTLIELMVTIAVMAIIAMMAAPSFSNLIASYQLNQSVDQFVLGLKEGRSRAATVRHNVVVCPDKNKTQQSITSMDCLSVAGITGAEAAKYINENRVILTQSSPKVVISRGSDPVFNVTFSQVGTSTASTIKFCLNGKAWNVMIYKLGTTNKEKKDSCA